MKKVLYVLNDCMRKFSYTRVSTLYRSLQEAGEPCSLFILRTDAYSGFAPEHNFIFLPVVGWISSIFTACLITAVTTRSFWM